MCERGRGRAHDTSLVIHFKTCVKGGGEGAKGGGISCNSLFQNMCEREGGRERASLVILHFKTCIGVC